jgi:hypothetical protein
MGYKRKTDPLIVLNARAGYSNEPEQSNKPLVVE